MSEAVRRVVRLVADRVSAAAGVAPVGTETRFVIEGVTADEVARRLLSGFVELEDLEAVLDHVERRTAQLIGSLKLLAADGDGDWSRRGASLFMSEVQCVAVGLALAAARADSGGGVTPLEAAGSRPPAHESFGAAVRPAHGGHPGSTV